MRGVITTNQPELKIIPIRHRFPAVVEVPEEFLPATTDPGPVRKKRNQTIRRLYITIAALVALCRIQWVAIYLMLPSVL